MLLGLGAVSPLAFEVQIDTGGGIIIWAGGSIDQTLNSGL